MTNERLGGIAARFLLIPFLLAVTFLGGYFLFINWDSYQTKTQLESYLPVRATSYTASKKGENGLTVAYEYTVNGMTYTSDHISAFRWVNDPFIRDEVARQELIQRSGELPVVYYNPEDPAEASLVRTVSHENVFNALGLGGAIFSGGLLLLYLATRRVRRVEELLEKPNTGAAAGAMWKIKSGKKDDDDLLPEEDRMLLDESLLKETNKLTR